MKPSRRFLAFCVVGTIGLGVDLAVLYGSAPLLGWYGGRVVSFIAAATATWHFNRRYTFRDALQHSGAGVLRQYLHYLASMLCGAAINYGLYVLVLNFIPVPHAAALGVALGSLGGLAVNFATARYLVFRRAGPGPRST